MNISAINFKVTEYSQISDNYHQPTRLRKAILHIDHPNKCFMNSADYPDICCTSSISEGKACKVSYKI